MRCAVIGSPIAHSLSPDLHRAAYAWLGLDWRYDRHEVDAAGVAGFVAGLDEQWRGLSVTMPCKAAIVELGTPDEVVRALGVGNTVIFGGVPSDRGTTTIHNTDVTGIQMVVRDAALDPAAPVVIFGNGATARSCVYALARLGVPRVAVRARDQAKTRALATDGACWGIEVTPTDAAAETVISTVPAPVAAAWAGDLARINLVFDVLYDPWPTPLVDAARHAGAHVRTGLDLLAAQAVGQVELMTGRSVDVAILREAADQALSRRGR